ncbi:MAG: SH3 domain-containing protein [Patescibacteria group bacterium]
MAKKEKDKKSEATSNVADATSNVEEKPKESKEEIKNEEEAPEVETGENIVDEEKEQEAAEKEQDYNSIFDDDYVENEKADKEKPEEEAEETKEEEPKEEESETEEESKTEPEEEVEGEEKKQSGESKDSSSKKSKKDKSEPEEKRKEKEEEPEEEKDNEIILDKKDKKGKKISKKKILIALAVLLALLLGAFGGYLYFKNTNKPKEEPAPAKTEEPQKEETKKEVYVTADGGLNMRENPDKNAKVLILIPNGTKLTVLEEKDGWYKVEYNGQTGWVSKDFVTEQKPDDMKTYTGTGFSPDGPKFSVKYPADWTINDYKISKTAGGLNYKIALGEGGHGGNDDPAIVNTQEDVIANGVTGKKTISKKDGKIVAVYTQFLKGDGYINIEFNPPVGYDDSYIEIYNKIVQTFKFL